MKKQSQQKEKTCADKVQGKYEKLVQEFIEAQRYYDIEETERYSPENTDQETGYWRFQLSWGGPSDEFRIYTVSEDTKDIEHIEYWFMDWFDGAKVNADADVILDICNMFLEVSN